MPASFHARKRFKLEVACSHNHAFNGDIRRQSYVQIIIKWIIKNVQHQKRTRIQSLHFRDHVRCTVSSWPCSHCGRKRLCAECCWRRSSVPVRPVHNWNIHPESVQHVELHCQHFALKIEKYVCGLLYLCYCDQIKYISKIFTCQTCARSNNKNKLCKEHNCAIFDFEQFKDDIYE